MPKGRCRIVGCLQQCRLFFQISEHDVIESHPDNVLEDLRLDRPFKTLVEFMDTQNLETMNKQVRKDFLIYF